MFSGCLAATVRCCEERSPNNDDGISSILIFGITGMMGGSVAEAARGSTWYKVTGFTRQEGGDIYDDMVTKGIRMLTGDMMTFDTVDKAMEGMDVVFLNTFYWDFMDPVVELTQGVNVVDAAMKHGVKHLIYAGTDYNPMTAQVKCPYLEGKAMVADYIISVGIPYTIVRMGFYFENFISVFRPYPLAKTKYAITIPIHSVPINCGSIYDFGQCISRIGLRPGTYAYTVIHLATEYLTVTQMVAAFNHNFHVAGVKFVDGKVTTKAFKALDFRGSHDLSSMFCHIRTQLEWDDSHVRTLCTTAQTLDDWVDRNEKIIQATLEEVFFDVFGFKAGFGSGRISGEEVADKIRRWTDFTRFLPFDANRKTKKASKRSVTVPRHSLGGYLMDKVGKLLGTTKESQL